MRSRHTNTTTHRVAKIDRKSNSKRENVSLFSLSTQLPVLFPAKYHSRVFSLVTHARLWDIQAFV